MNPAVNTINNRLSRRPATGGEVEAAAGAGRGPLGDELRHLSLAHPEGEQCLQQERGQAMSKAGVFLTIFMATSALALGAVGALAEESPLLQRGARVRATLVEPGFNGLTVSKSIAGRLLDVTATDITLETSPDRPPMVLPLQNISGLELKVQQGHRNRGALIGGGAVLATGLLASLALDDDLRDDTDEWQFFSDRTAAIILTVALVPVGALVGALVAPGTKWQPIPSDRIRLGLDRGPGGESRLGVALRF